LRLANIHLSNNYYAKEQLRELLELLEARGTRPIIAGDFNIFDLDAERALFEANYTSSTAFRQYKSFLSENITLDYVLLPKEYRFRSLDLTPGLSDHSALSFEIDTP
jgi:endonuclease/exonuclease/phosphatase family metal-dependent hydrolase